MQSYLNILTSSRIIVARCASLLVLLVVLYGLSFESWQITTFSRLQTVETLRKKRKANTDVPPNVSQDLSFNAHPLDLTSCVTFRVRGSGSSTLHVSNSTHIYETFQKNKKLRVGFEFVEHPEHFLSAGGAAKLFHFYHFLEFMVLAMYHVLPPHSKQSLKSMPEISWVYVPLFTRREICGAESLNCKVIEMLTPFQERPPRIYGLEANDPKMLPLADPGYSGRLDFRTVTLPSTVEEQAATYEQMVQEVDAIILLDRLKCGDESQVPINKIWTNYIETFPSNHWYQLVQHSLSNLPVWPTNPNKLVTCYIDRQKFGRGLPDFYHQWLTEYLSGNEDLQFFHVYMENLKGLDQIRLASACQVMIGAHGNGLSHAFWMKPESYVVELFWNFPYVYDYNTVAQLMKHNYLGLWDLTVLPFDTKISDLLELKKQNKPIPGFGGQHWTDMTSESVERGTLALKSFLQRAMKEKGLK